MTVLFMLIGAVLGALVCAGMFEEPTGWTGAVFGLICGLLLANLRTLRARVAKLEAEQLQRTIAAATSAAGVASADIAEPATSTTKIRAAEPDSVAPISIAAADLAVPAAAAPATPTAAEPLAVSGRTEPAEAAPPTVQSLPPPSIWDNARPAENPALAWIKRWFTEGNVPVKVGVIVLFLGVAALLKYAADQGWLHLPMEFRLAGIAAAALAGMVFAWRKRETHRSFALSVQGGAIGVLILTIFAAYRLYALLPAGLAFGLLVVVVAGGAMLAVLQDALALAVLAIVGGFLAPILISTGHGNHVALFGYYAVLNAAVFGIAWIRPWRMLNLIGFAFTFGVGTLWGAQQYQPEFFASTEPFLLLFFAFYLLIPMLYALRQAPERRDLIDGTLVFGTPLIAFALQVALLQRARLPLAFSALGAAAIYTALAALELRRWRLTLLGQSHALLALGFATLAVPLALSARSTSATWALEGAALVWLGVRQQRRLPQWLGCALQPGAAVAFVFAHSGSYVDAAILNGPILNGEFCGAVLIAVAGFISARLLGRADVRMPAIALFLWGWAWLWFACGHEIDRFAPSVSAANWWLALIAATGLIGAEIHRRFNWRECTWPALALFPLALPLIGLSADADHGPLESWGAALWAFWLAAALRTLAAFAARGEASLRFVHFALLWILVLLLGTEFGHLAWRHLVLGDIWVILASLAPAAVLFWLVLRRQPLVRWPSAEIAETTRPWLLASIAAILGLFWLFGLQHLGDPTPVPYLPLLNPLEIAQLGYLLLLLAWFAQSAREGGALLDAELRARVLALAGVLLLTAVTLRGAHFLGGVPWSPALWDSPLAQAALSITWTVAGIVAMLLGQRRGSRAVWFGGAALMGVVLVKLLLIDRRFLHDLPAIIGVLVVGVLLVAVGYFAPVPPRVMQTGEKA